jgi:lipopolysaccharide export LptBFGC system permease protein LptF
MRTIDRYVAREFIRLFVLFILAAPMLFIIGDWTDNIGRYTEQGIPTSRVALSYMYQSRCSSRGRSPWPPSSPPSSR